LNKIDKAIIRVDASLKIGSGHVMRCLTLAEALRELGTEVQFVCRWHFGNLIELIREKGFVVHELPVLENIELGRIYEYNSGSVYENWLGVSQEQDARETITVFQKNKPDWLIVDHYGLVQVWEKKLRPHVHKIMVIDDLANRSHDCDLLLDQNYFIDGESRYEDLVPETCTKLLGPQYALLRSEFTQARKQLKPRIGKIERVFVFFGGNDLENVTGKALEALSFQEFNCLDVDVVIGSHNPHLTKIERQVRTRLRTKLHVQVENIAELMAQADLAIGAGGATTWERMAVGLPSIVVTIAENQIPFTKNLDQENCLHWLGRSKAVEVKELRESILDVVAKESINRLQSKKGMDIVRGDGTLKVSKILTNGILSGSWTIRKATASDCELYWHWANDTVVRQNAFNSEKIAWKEHQEWFDARLVDLSTILYLVVGNNLGPIGQVRFEQSGQHFIISYSIGRQFRGLGLGKKLLASVIEVFRETHRFDLIGEVKKDNLVSAKVFENLEFQEIPSSRKSGVRRFQLQFSPIVTHG
jgi:UDP-2,4-diacetamido-2,4,6-trideoxy-beta-L-altropyranose hydrolase